MAESQVHFKLDGSVILGRNPDIGFDPVESQRIKGLAKAEAFQKVIDTENNNEAYAEDIALIEGYFASKGLQIDPLRIVTPATVDKAYRAAGNDPTHQVSEAEGRHVYGRSYIVDKEYDPKLYGKNIMLGLGLHEAAHSLTGKTTDITITRQEQSINSLGDPHVITHLGGVANARAFGKADLRKDAPRALTGDFWLEAFADLTRVRALRELERSNHMSGHPKVVDYGNGLVVHVLSANSIAPLVSPETDGIAMPAEFALIARTQVPTMRNVTGTSAANFAAYGLDLLDQAQPGLYDTMLAGIYDPRAQAEFIRNVEAVKPGLYRELGMLPYSDEGFTTGLLAIGAALGRLNEPIKG